MSTRLLLGRVRPLHTACDIDALLTSIRRALPVGQCASHDPRRLHPRCSHVQARKPQRSSAPARPSRPCRRRPLGCAAAGQAGKVVSASLATQMYGLELPMTAQIAGMVCTLDDVGDELGSDVSAALACIVLLAPAKRACTSPTTP